MHCGRLRIDDPSWTQFVLAQQEATLFHHPAWSQLLAKAYGYEPFALTLVGETGEIVAGLPMMEIRSGLTGRRFVSLPFTDYCPPLMHGDVSSDDIVDVLCREWDAAVPLEVRAGLPQRPGIHWRPGAVRHTLALKSDEDSVLASFSRMHRQNIRRSEQSRLRVVRDLTPLGMAAFYRLHLSTRHRLGIPVQPWRFFQRLHKTVIQSGLGFVLLALAEGTPVAASVFLGWNGTLIYKYAASDPKSWPLRPNNAVAWAAISWACRHGYRLFDFGRTDLANQGLRDFKDGWGAREEPLIYSVLSDRAPQPLNSQAQQALSWLIRHSPPSVCRVLGELLYAHVD